MTIFKMVMEGNHRENQGKLDDLAGAFPNKDPKGHCVAHEAMIKRDLATAEFWDKLKEKLAVGGVLSMAGVMVSALGYYALKIIAEHLPK